VKVNRVLSCSQSPLHQCINKRALLWVTHIGVMMKHHTGSIGSKLLHIRCYGKR